MNANAEMTTLVLRMPTYGAIKKGENTAHGDRTRHVT